ncbi:hypothetical protein OH733_05575 [Streptomyces griseus]|uniref:hypothetical protein n=1 Tax=Streptomyces griseus TaxID=1911 RepID=UPI00386F8037|nr:hypothetical protein OH733_05575 [Streptomyces griseus]WTD71140.1 hypothetical protein OH763_31410 [Streptomyces griseus]
MAAELKHGRLAYVVPHGTHEVVLAKFINADPATQGFFVFFGTDLQLWPEDVELVELAVTRGV